jgi:spore coat polysaccharide biosynthesis predicted glycosyltransferase SpsG
MYAADVVIGAGGTMTREAALLGAPTISIFAGRPAAAGRWLEQRGVLRIVAPGAEIGPLRPREREPVAVEELQTDGQAGVDAFVSATLDAARRS